MGITLLRGRDFTQKESDSAEPVAVVVNEVQARQLWPGQDPIGKRLVVGTRRQRAK